MFAGDGVEALEHLDADADIEIVVTDLNMPRMDGLTLLSRLAERGRRHKSVVVTAYGDMENIRTAMNRGAFDFLTKPIDLPTSRSRSTKPARPSSASARPTASARRSVATSPTRSRRRSSPNRTRSTSAARRARCRS